MGIEEIIDSIKADNCWTAMNPPEEPTKIAYVETDYKTKARWVCCPFCGKRQFKLSDDAIISKQEFQCSGKSCMKQYEVNTV